MFPGAQWVGDGTQLVLQWNDERFVFNIQAIVDPATGATVAAHVSDAEDAQAVIDAFDQAVTTTEGQPPLAYTLDNKACNLTDAVQDAVAPATVLHSTPGRGQSKAPVEGAFGLFQQAAPPLVIAGRTVKDLARSALSLLATLWALGRNGRPRSTLGNRSPAQAYMGAVVTDDQVDQAKLWIAELQRREVLARRSRAARADPVRKQFLEEAFKRIQIDDKEGRLAAALAVYGQDALERGIATFEAKLERNTLPAGVERGRYLAGIIMNIDGRLEAQAIADHLLRLRLRARLLSLQTLEAQAKELAAKPPADRAKEAIDRALSADRLLHFRFWTQQAALALAHIDEQRVTDAYSALTKHAAAAFKVDRLRRDDLIAALAQAVAERRPQ